MPAMDRRLGRLKVFGLGLNKTGTTTLGKCLRHFGYRHVSCRRDLLERLRAADLEPIFKVIDEYDSFEDWPFPLMYRELFSRYGDRARYILTTRSSPQRWLESLKSHALRTPTDQQCRTLVYGFDYPHGHESDHLAFYDRHNANVRAFFRDQDAQHLFLDLCWERGDGWQQLCPFLSLPIPAIPFPHSNRGADLETDAQVLVDNHVNVARQLALLGVTDATAYPTKLPAVRRAKTSMTPAARRSILPWASLVAGLAAAALVLVAFINPASTSRAERGLRFIARTDIEDLHDALRAFHQDTGRVPTAGEGLVALVEPPPGVSNWRGPYWDPRRRDVSDPWGRPYVYRTPPSAGTRFAVEIRSLGPDGIEATPDDVVD
jgi:type II secretion system protein G